jgi:uncharacterized protein (DUF362 family)
MGERPTVGIISGPDRRENIRQAMSHVGFLTSGTPANTLLAEAEKMFIHPNLVTHHWKGATTDVDAVRAVLDVISLHRADEVVVGDAGFHNTKKAFEAFDYPSLSRSGNVKLLDLNDGETEDVGFAYDREFQKQPMKIAKTVIDSDCRIIVVPPKMHAYYTVSLALKTHIIGSMVVKRTPFGIYARWPWVHAGYAPAHKTLADMYRTFPAHAAVIDGKEAMEGNGPASGAVVELDWAIVSLDPVAADALACWLMGFEIEEVGYLTYLHETGSTVDPEQMDIVGDPNWRDLRRTLQRPDTWPDIMSWKDASVPKH